MDMTKIIGNKIIGWAQLIEQNNFIKNTDSHKRHVQYGNPSKTTGCWNEKGIAKAWGLYVHTKFLFNIFILEIKPRLFKFDWFLVLGPWDPFISKANPYFCRLILVSR